MATDFKKLRSYLDSAPSNYFRVIYGLKTNFQNVFLVDQCYKRNTPQNHLKLEGYPTSSIQFTVGFCHVDKR